MWRKFPDDDTFFSIMQAHGLKLRRGMACSSQGKYHGRERDSKDGGRGFILHDNIAQGRDAKMRKHTINAISPPF